MRSNVKTYPRASAERSSARGYSARFTRTGQPFLAYSRGRRQGRSAPAHGAGVGAARSGRADDPGPIAAHASVPQAASSIIASSR